jgi:hypothetical protein
LEPSAFSFNHWQTMPHARAIAGIRTFGEFVTRIGTPLVNAAADTLSNLTRQCCASNGHVIGASHAADAVVDWGDQATGDRPAVDVQFKYRKINAKAGATGATLLALRHGKRGLKGDPAAGTP